MQRSVVSTRNKTTGTHLLAFCEVWFLPQRIGTVESPGAAHGFTATPQDQVNADLLKFIGEAQKKFASSLSGRRGARKIEVFLCDLPLPGGAQRKKLLIARCPPFSSSIL
jgi:hypothetical protein